MHLFIYTYIHTYIHNNTFSALITGHKYLPVKLLESVMVIKGYTNKMELNIICIQDCTATAAIYAEMQHANKCVAQCAVES